MRANSQDVENQNDEKNGVKKVVKKKLTARQEDEIIEAQILAEENAKKDTNNK